MPKDKDFTPILEFLIENGDPRSWSWREGVNPAMWARLLGEGGALSEIPGMEGMDPEKGYRLKDMAEIGNFLMNILPAAAASGAIPADVGYRGKVDLVPDDMRKAVMSRAERAMKGIRDRAGSLSDSLARGAMKAYIDPLDSRARDLIDRKDAADVLVGPRKASMEATLKDQWDSLNRDYEAVSKGDGLRMILKALADKGFRLEDGVDRLGRPMRRWTLNGEPYYSRMASQALGGKTELGDRAAIDAYLRDVKSLKEAGDALDLMSDKDKAAEWLGGVLADSMASKDLNPLFGPPVAGGEHLVRKKKKTIDSNGNEKWETAPMVEVAPGKWRSEWAVKRPKHSINLLDFNSPFWKERAGSEGALDDYLSGMEDLIGNSIKWKGPDGKSRRSISPADLEAMGDPYLKDALGKYYDSDRKAFPGLWESAGDSFKNIYLQYEKDRNDAPYMAQSEEERGELQKGHEESLQRKLDKESADRRARSGAARVVLTKGGAAKVKSGEQERKDFQKFVKAMFTNEHPGSDDPKKMRYNRLDSLVSKFGKEIDSPEIRTVMKMPEIREIYREGRATGRSPEEIQDDMARAALAYSKSNKDQGASDERQKNIASAIVGVMPPGFMKEDDE